MIFLCKQMAMAALVLATMASVSPATAAGPARPDRSAWTGVVTYVTDGDTVRVRPPDGGKPVSIRIDGIDAPEICQPGGTDARDALKRRLLGERVVVKSKARDTYGRLVAQISFQNQDQGQWLVSQGLAWSARYRSSPGPYAAEQFQAQAARLGLFAPVRAAAPVYPGEFRKKHGSCYVRQR